MGLIKLIKSSKIYKDYRAEKKKKGALKRELAAIEKDAQFFIKRHESIFGVTPNFKNPSTFNEKINHRSLYDRNPLYTPLADKLKARIYIAFMLRDFASINTGGGGGGNTP